jgi:hypothetical protein
MDSSNKLIWALVGAPILAIAAMMLFGEDTDRAKFDRLEVGMTAKEVEYILDPPRGGKYGHHRRKPIRDTENLHWNNHMVLTIRGGVLVDKKWVGKEKE